MSLDACPIKLGTILQDWTGTFSAATQPTHWAQGRVFTVENVASQSGNRTPSTRPNGSFLRVMVVRNIGTGTLLPKRLAKLKVGNTAHAVMNEVAGVGNAYADPFCAPVDPYLPSTGVPTGYLCLIVVGGPAYCKLSATDTDTITDITIGMPLVCSAAGSGLTDVLVGGTVANADPGSAGSAAAAQTGAIINTAGLIGNALEAKAKTADASGDILVLVNCLWAPK